MRKTFKVKSPGIRALTKFYKNALKNIRSEVAMRAQWNSPDTLGLKYAHHMKLEALVELVEEWDCGSIGGFGVGQEGHNFRSNLLERAEWLLNKYDPRAK